MPLRTALRSLLATGIGVVLGWAFTMQHVRAQDTGLERGRALAQRLCAHCHLGDGQGEKQGKDSIPGFRAVARRPNQSAEGVVQWLRSRPKMMPDHHLSIEEAYDLAEFILSLKPER